MRAASSGVEVAVAVDASHDQYKGLPSSRIRVLYSRARAWIIFSRHRRVRSCNMCFSIDSISALWRIVIKVGKSEVTL